MTSGTRNFAALCLAVLLIAVSYTTAFAQSEGVLIFNGKDASGQSQAIPDGVFQVSGKALGSEVSVKVSKEYNVRFCAGKDGSGTCEEFGEGTHNLASIDFNYIKVWKGAPTPASTVSASTSTVSPSTSSGGPIPLLVYEQMNWGGRAQNFGVGMFRSFRGEFGKLNDNQARSVVIAKGYRVRFCSEEGINYRGAGDCEIHEDGKFNLRFANSISFIEVTDLSDTSPDDEKLPVVLYEDQSQAGRMQGFDVGTFVASKGEFKKLGNDRASSIQVKNGYHASVCSDEPASAGSEPGGCEEFSSGRKNLKNKNSASYIRVWKD